MRRREAVPALVVAAAALRAPGLDAALPYLAYVDEGHVLHRVVHMLAADTWDPGWYRYPSLLMYAIVLASRPWVPADAAVPSRYYDVVEPPALILVGRVVVWLFAAGTVALVGWLGGRLAGARAGAVAAALAAVLPALVARSAIVVVDTPSAFFATAALALAARTAARPAAPGAAAAGVAAGLAAATKYPAGAVLVAVLATVAGWRVPVRARLAGAAAAVAGCGAGLVLGFPAGVVRPRAVLRHLASQATSYETYAATPGYLAQALGWSEIGPAVLALAAAGTGLLLRDPRARAVTLGWLGFAAVLLAALLRYDFQPFRNLLPLVPFACVAAATAIVRAAERLAPARAGVVTVVLAAAVAAPSAVRGLGPVLARAGVVDTRVVARAWLEAHRTPGEPVVLAEELAFVPREVARLGGGVTVVPWAEVAAAMRRGAWTWAVAPQPSAATPADVAQAWRAAVAGRRPVFAVGRGPTPAAPGYWRGNDQRIVVHRRP